MTPPPSLNPAREPEGRYRHEPVMIDRIAGLLAPALSASDTEPVLVDATLGLGGHSARILADHPRARVVGIDRDPEALEQATSRLAPFGERFRGVRAVFDEIPEVLAAAGAPAPNAFLFDLGVSSLQLDSDARGFAYARDTHLDMRMDPDGPVTAADVVNGYSPEELTRVFREYGEERFAGRIARAIVRRRAAAPLSSSADLASLVSDSVPAAARRRGHPAKRVFQALRIEVNDELAVLRRALEQAVRHVAVGGRIVVLAYHSGEDRIVKRAFASGVRPPVPPDLPVVPDTARPFLEALTRGSESPAPAEVAANPRAASARLRAVVRTGPVPDSWRVAA